MPGITKKSPKKSHINIYVDSWGPLLVTSHFCTKSRSVGTPLVTSRFRTKRGHFGPGHTITAGTSNFRAAQKLPKSQFLSKKGDQYWVWTERQNFLSFLSKKSNSLESSWPWSLHYCWEPGSNATVLAVFLNSGFVLPVSDS